MLKHRKEKSILKKGFLLFLSQHENLINYNKIKKICRIHFNESECVLFLSFKTWYN